MLKSNAVKFSVTFIVLFAVFYYFNIGFLSITSPGSKNYISFFDDNLNYIRWLRHTLIFCTSTLVELMGFKTLRSDYELFIIDRKILRVAFDCLGIGVMCFFTAFVIAYPKPTKKKVLFIIAGLFGIMIINIVRLTLIALYWSPRLQQIVDHHIIFNAVIYSLIMLALYFWVTADDRKTHAKN